MTDNINPHERELILDAVAEKAGGDPDYAMLYLKLPHAELDEIYLTLRSN